MFRDFLKSQGPTETLESLASRMGVSSGTTFLVEWPGDEPARTGTWFRVLDASERPLFEVARDHEAGEALSRSWREKIRHPSSPPGTVLEYRLHVLAWRIATPHDPDVCRVAYLHFDESSRRPADPSAEGSYSYLETAWDSVQLYDPSQRVVLYTAFGVVSPTPGSPTVLNLLLPNGDVVARRVLTSPTSARFESPEGVVLGGITRSARPMGSDRHPIERVEVAGTTTPLVPVFASMVGWLRDTLAGISKRRSTH